MTDEGHREFPIRILFKTGFIQRRSRSLGLTDYVQSKMQSVWSQMRNCAASPKIIMLEKSCETVQKILA